MRTCRAPVNCSPSQGRLAAELGRSSRVWHSGARLDRRDRGDDGPPRVVQIGETVGAEMSHLKIAAFLVLAAWPLPASAADPLSILDYGAAGVPVDRTGKADASQALAGAITAANALTAKGLPACVYIPTGTYRIVSSPPEFVKAGCVKGDGPTQSVLAIDPQFSGDLFAWSEAWANTAGPTVTGLKIVGDKAARNIQNALVFYDRNDEVFIDNLVVEDLHGRALYSGVTKHAPKAYMRESDMRTLRFFRDGAPGVPVVEFTSAGTGQTDATNEIKISQIDIYGANGPSFVIRNGGSGGVRTMMIDGLRIEGAENGKTEADLLVIGDRAMSGNVNSIVLNDVELVDPYAGYAALRITAPPGSRSAPYQITVRGSIGGGVPHGEGINIEAGRLLFFQLSGMHTDGTNVVIGPGVGRVVLDGWGQEACWTYKIDPKSEANILTPALLSGDPAKPNTDQPFARPNRC